MTKLENIIRGGVVYFSKSTDCFVKENDKRNVNYNAIELVNETFGKEELQKYHSK